ncbi:MAG: bifunctional oligoribonuclease/PAP phosphatase NrnA [Chitinophagaceae bacterium]|nr:bifunctional oligoribonuclease/PAP phosphatase NrnA [Chitinophagaceae bacterium]
MRHIQDLYGSLAQKRKIVVTFHQKPDGDAMGSALGLYHFLIQFGHEVTVVCPTNWAGFLNWMPGTDKVLDFDHKKEAATLKMKEADWIFCLDFNTPARTKNMEPVLREVSAKKILIDHHQQPLVEFFDYGISNVDKSSTAEMVYDFIEDSGNDSKINSAIAQCLYAGVMTDTGSFRFPSTTASVHLMVARLMQTGFDHSKVHENLFDNFLENRFRFFGNTLLHRMEVFYEYNTALISIPQHDLIKFNIQTGDTEGLVNFPLSIRGIKLAAIIIDRGDERKSSFRSKGEFDVNRFARKYFNGGGHPNAAGGRNTEPLDEVVKIFKRALKENESLLA